MIFKFRSVLYICDTSIAKRCCSSKNLNLYLEHKEWLLGAVSFVII